MSDAIEALEFALRAVQEKYGYACVDVAYDAESAQPWYAAVTYPNAPYTMESFGYTLREALSAASVDALNSEAAE